LQFLLLLSNGPELALHRHDRELKKTCINFIPCSAWTISSFCQTIIFFGAIYIHCGGRHPVVVVCGWYAALLFGLFHGDTLIFDYHFIFNLFEVLLNYIILFYIYTWILIYIHCGGRHPVVVVWLRL
jgi:hypothetical protein